MIVNKTYEQARLDAIHVLSNYENFPTTITITQRIKNGKTEWVLEYKEEYKEGEEND